METICVFCDKEEAQQGSEHCSGCNEVLTADRLADEAVAMERDGILTEEDALHGSNTGC